MSGLDKDSSSLRASPNVDIDERAAERTALDNHLTPQIQAVLHAGIRRFNRLPTIDQAYKGLLKHLENHQQESLVQVVQNNADYVQSSLKAAGCQEAIRAADAQYFTSDVEKRYLEQHVLRKGLLERCIAVCQKKRSRMPTVEEGMLYLETAVSNNSLCLSLVQSQSTYLQFKMESLGYMNRRDLQEKEKANLDAMQKRILSWLHSKKNSTKADSPEQLQAAYLREHPDDAKLLAQHVKEYSALFITVYEQQQKMEENNIRDLQRYIATWARGADIDLSVIKSAADLQKLYLRQHPDSRKLLDTHRQVVTDIFEQEYKRRYQVLTASTKEARNELLRAVPVLLTSVDIPNEKFADSTVFRDEMLKRLEGVLSKHTFPPDEQRTLQKFAGEQIAKLHQHWLRENTALGLYEMRQLEEAVSTYEPKAASGVMTFTLFLEQFLRNCPCQAVAQKHQQRVRELLLQRWQQYSETSEATPGSGSDSPQTAVVSAELREMEVAIAASTQTGQALPPHIQQKLSALLSEGVRNRFASVDWEAIAPTLASVLTVGRFKPGSQRLQRLSESSKVTDLLSGREDKLAPFLLAMCGSLDGDEEIRRCLQEVKLSENPRDTLRIVFASPECRKAATRVRQNATLWSQFTQALSSIGLTLQDLNMEPDDDEEFQTEIDQDQTTLASITCGDDVPSDTETEPKSSKESEGLSQDLSGLSGEVMQQYEADTAEASAVKPDVFEDDEEPVSLLDQDMKESRRKINSTVTLAA